jgi:hypothetical protein
MWSLLFFSESTVDLGFREPYKEYVTHRVYLLGRVNHRNDRGQLQINHKVDMAVDLIPQRSLLGGYDLLKTGTYFSRSASNCWSTATALFM